jgi:hypothetical protein
MRVIGEQPYCLEEALLRGHMWSYYHVPVVEPSERNGHSAASWRAGAAATVALGLKSREPSRQPLEALAQISGATGRARRWPPNSTA